MNTYNLSALNVFIGWVNPLSVSQKVSFFISSLVFSNVSCMVIGGNASLSVGPLAIT